MNKLIQYCVMAAVGVLVFASLLIPIVNEASATNATFTNEGYYSLVKIDDTTDATIIWDASNPTVFNINGSDIDLTATGRLTILGSDKICVRYSTASNTHQIQVFGSYGGVQGYKAANESSGDVATITIHAGVVSVAISNEAAKDFDLGNDAYLLTADTTTADYVAVMKITTEKAYLLKDSEIVICGISVANSRTEGIGVFAKGTMGDGITFSTFYVGSNYTGDVTFTDITTYAEEMNGYKDLYALEKYTATINYNGGSTSNATYSYFIVPAEVVAEKTVHADDSTRAIIGVIPIIVIVGLVAAIVGVVAIRRNA